MFAAVSVVALVLSCVAIALFTTHNSDATNDDYEKRIQDIEGKNDDYEKRIQEIELKLKSHGEVDAPEVSEIKPLDAFMISNHLNKYGAELVIDKDEGTYIVTNRHTNPWWAADMGGIYNIKRVVIINRKDGWTERSTNLRVGVMDRRPVVGQNLALDAYTLCD